MTDLVVSYKHRRLRKWLEANGYTLVNHERLRSIKSAALRQYAERRQEWDCQSALYEAQDRIKELEAEIEAHKRVETALAERVLKAAERG
jgi:hypothetical protein